MRRRQFWMACALAVAAGMLGGSASALQAEPDPAELAVIVHPDNRAQITAALLEDLFLRRQTQWSDGDRVIPLNAPPDAAPRQAFDRAVLAMSPDEVARYWLDQRIRGAGSAPREVGEVALTIKLVTKLKAAVGYVPAFAALEGVRIVARVRGGKLILP
ncbi:MAG TPA: hypothetical protein VGC42_06185 [Kofleriaceae bacterium]